MFRVLVCGGRDYAAYARLCSTLDRLLVNRLPEVVIIHGGASGADSLAGRYAAERGLTCEVFEADWKTHGRAAGPIRNARMLAEGKPDTVVAFPGGRGTANMVALARAAGVTVREVA
jgi:predicted Rossmann-fold nucleotide-binding protein